MNLTMTSRPLVVLGEHDRRGERLRVGQGLISPLQDARISALEVNDLLGNFVSVLKDIADERKLRNLVIGERLEYLQDLVRRTVSNYETIKVFTGIPFIEVIREGRQGGHDLIIKLAHRRSDHGDEYFDSTDLHLMQKSPIPVMILNPDKPQIPNSLLAAVDVSNPAMDKSNQHTVDQAASLAARFHCDIHLLHVCLPPVADFRVGSSSRRKISRERRANASNGLMFAAQTRMQALARRVRRATEFSCSRCIQIVRGLAESALPAYLERHNIGLLLMGTAGQSHDARPHQGYRLESILSRVNCSVMAINPSGINAPVQVMPHAAMVLPEAG